NIEAFFRHLLERVDWQRDLHFQARTTIDTLDYSGDRLNEGSKLVIAAAGPIQRTLPTEMTDLRLPDGFHSPRLSLPGVLAIAGPALGPDEPQAAGAVERFCAAISPQDPINRFPLLVVVDDSE